MNFSTGNINFDGDVTIRGDIEVRGLIEAATIHCGGNLIVRRGMAGWKCGDI